MNPTVRHNHSWFENPVVSSHIELKTVIISIWCFYKWLLHTWSRLHYRKLFLCWSEQSRANSIASFSHPSWTIISREGGVLYFNKTNLSSCHFAKPLLNRWRLHHSGCGDACKADHIRKLLALIAAQCSYRSQSLHANSPPSSQPRVFLLMIAT